MRYGFLGLGNMATAIIRGMVKSGAYEKSEIFGYDPQQSQIQNLERSCGLVACSGPAELAAAVDVVVLAVKPQVLPQVLPQIGPGCSGKLVISIAAGKDIAFLRAGLGNVAVIRVMPNINARVGAATSCFSAGPGATQDHKELARALFETVGTVVELPESQIAAFSAIAGASPAFTYIYIDALARAAVKAGMPRQVAQAAAASAVMGSAKMVMESGEHPHALVDQVCSPGGTTIQGVCKLADCAFEGAVEQAVSAVIERDQKL